MSSRAHYTDSDEYFVCWYKLIQVHAMKFWSQLTIRHSPFTARSPRAVSYLRKKILRNSVNHISIQIDFYWHIIKAYSTHSLLIVSLGRVAATGISPVQIGEFSAFNDIYILLN